jgi:polyisoprenoid-binding protein YceI
MNTASDTGVPATGTWKIDSVHSSATFRIVHHKIATFRGHFHDVEGALVNGVLTGSVRTESIDVGSVAMFKEHMLGPDWFDNANHPMLSFTSTELHAHGDHLHAAGELTIRGVTKPVDISGAVYGPTAVANHDGSSSDRLGLDLAAQINRKDFGVSGNGGVEDEVVLEISLELVAE